MTFRRKLLPPSLGWLNVSEEDAEEIGRQELVICTERIYTSNWPKFLQFPIVELLHSLQHPLKPDWVSLKTKSACATETSAKALATEFQTASPINSYHLNSYSCGNKKTFCITQLLTWLTLCLIAGNRWHWPCGVESQRNKMSLTYVQRKYPSNFVRECSALISCTFLKGQT